MSATYVRLDFVDHVHPKATSTRYAREKGSIFIASDWIMQALDETEPLSIWLDDDEEYFFLSSITSASSSRSATARSFTRSTHGCSRRNASRSTRPKKTSTRTASGSSPITTRRGSRSTYGKEHVVIEFDIEDRRLVGKALTEMAKRCRSQAIDARLNFHVLPQVMQKRALEHAAELDGCAQKLDRFASLIVRDNYVLKLEPTRKS